MCLLTGQCGNSTCVSTLDLVTEDQAEQNLEQALVEYERAVDGEGTLITGWVVVAEFLTREGVPHLAAYASRGLPYWRIDGMIEAAHSTIAYAVEDEDIDDD